MKNYYAILEVPVGCGVTEIHQAYQRLMQENMDNEAVSADLKEAHEVLTTPAQRGDYDQALWGQTFAPNGGGESSAPGGADTKTLLPSGLASLTPSGGAGRCPMGDEAQCPVLLGRVGQTDIYCPECGYLLAGLNAASGFDQTDTADADRAARLEEPDGRSHRLRPGLNTVGRESADVLLPDKTVSRQHARLEVSDDGGITLEDLSSTNGTQVGGDVLVPHVPRTLQAGNRIRFGSVIVVLHLPAQEQDPAPGVDFGRAEPERPAADGARSASSETGSPGLPSHENARAQVVETREEGGRAYPLIQGVTTFGRRADNSVVLQGDPYVSGSHAQIIADGDVFRLTDIGSTNGTLLNGQRLAINEPVTLSPDDVILIGGTAMRFELINAAEETPMAEAAKTEIAETKPEDVPAEPRERTAPEYDVPEDTGVTEHGHGQDSPTQVER